MHELKEKIDKRLGKYLIILETIIAIFTVFVMVCLLVEEVWVMFSDPSHLLGAENSVTTYLHHMLDIVIGLEFVKLLMHLTPGNILEVLTMALSRSIIVNHGSALENLLSIACIIGLFAAKRYLIPRAELNKEMDESAPEPHHHRGHRKHKHKHDDHPHEEHHHNEHKDEVH